MDKAKAQRIGAGHHDGGTPSRTLSEDDRVPVDARMMYLHGWRTGHVSCDCQVMRGHVNINAQVNMTVD